MGQCLSQCTNLLSFLPFISGQASTYTVLPTISTGSRHRRNHYAPLESVGDGRVSYYPTRQERARSRSQLWAGSGEDNDDGSDSDISDALAKDLIRSARPVGARTNEWSDARLYSNEQVRRLISPTGGGADDTDQYHSVQAIIGETSDSEHEDHYLAVQEEEELPEIEVLAVTPAVARKQSMTSFRAFSDDDDDGGLYTAAATTATTAEDDFSVNMEEIEQFLSGR